MKKTSRLQRQNTDLKHATVHSPIPPEDLRWQCDPQSLRVRTTDDVRESRDIVGQPRALRALRVGLEMRHFGYNIFVTGISGTGRTTTIKRMLGEFEKKDGQLFDFCYVYNFENPDMPLALSFPAGRGSAFRNDMARLLTDLRKNIPGLFESHRFQEARKTILQHFTDRQKIVMSDFEKKVQEQGFTVVQVQMGNIVRPDVLPVVKGNPVAVEQVEAMAAKGEVSQDDLQSIRTKQQGLEKHMALVFRELRNIEKKLEESLSEMEMKMAAPMIDEAFEPLRTAYAYPKVLDYLAEVRKSISRNLERFRKSGQQRKDDDGGDGSEVPPDPFLEYEVNLLVDNADTETIPIVIETNPKYRNIFGTIERVMEKGGVWKTDFTRIKAGSLLRANGGYLVLNALDTLVEPGVWQDLKRTLRTGIVEVHTFEPLWGFAPTALKPEPIDLNLKVIMIGDAEIYQLLYFRDDDFKKIFKIRADFDTEMPKSKQSVASYLGFMRMVSADEGLMPFDAKAMAQVVEFGVRLAGNKRKISTRFNVIADVIREANYWATKEKASQVTYRHVEKAIAERIDRVKLYEEKLQEMIDEGTIMIDTDGSVVGQVNGLSVYDVGEYAFGKPSRITARTSFGQAGIINIEREAELSGPTHNKGVAIIGGFLRGRFAQDKPLAVNASITFEQSYGGVDGDSASSTEIYAILSSLANVPISQGIAVTGSVNQKGEVQPIGGVNLKIEGFYDVCKARGFTGRQGVIVPAQNVADLMLREEVVEAVRKGKFHVWAIRTIDEGIEILTGTKAGKRRPDGSFESGTINDSADRRLRRYAQDWKEFNRPAPLMP